MVRKRFTWLAVILTFALIAGACGDSSDDTTTTTAADAATTQAPTTTAAPATTAAPETTAAPDTTEAPMAAGEGYKVAFIYDGFQIDGGWNEAHEIGRRAIEDAFPGIETTFVEEIPPGATAQAAMDDFAADGYDMIIGTTFYMFDAMEVAPLYPDVIFLTWGGVGLLDNMGQYDGASEDGRYLDGLIAGSMVSEGATIGYVGGFPIEEVNRAANAFTIGVREVNPTATVELVFINSWWDPPVEQQATQALIDAGVEAVSHELNSAAVPSTAEAAGVYISGYGFDASANAPTKWLSSFVWNWGAYYVDQVQAMIDGNWEAAQFYGGLEDNMITMSSFGPDVPQDVIDLVNSRMAELTAGTFDIFAGPILDNEGNEIVPAGGTIAKADRPGCCLWLIEGIEGEIPAG